MTNPPSGDNGLENERPDFSREAAKVFSRGRKPPEHDAF
jgi:hypothetical protein